MKSGISMICKHSMLNGLSFKILGAKERGSDPDLSTRSALLQK